MALRERSEVLAEQVKSQESREKAIQEALVSAQTLREEISQQASREAQNLREHAKKEAELLTQQAQAEARQVREKAEAEVATIRQRAVGDTELLRQRTESELERLTAELERVVEERTGIIDELERKRTRFLRAFRSLLERELDAVAIEEGKVASEDAILELDLTGGQRRVQARMIETAALGLLPEDGDDEAAGSSAAAVAEETRVESADTAPVTEVASTEAPAPETREAPAAEIQAAVEVPSPDVREEPEAAIEAASDTVVQFEVVEPELVAEVVESPEAPSDDRVEISLVSEQPASYETGPSGEIDAGEDLLDTPFSLADGEEPELTAVEQPGGDELDSLVDRVLADDAPEEAVVIPIDTLAPEGDGDPLDDEARAAVNQLFDREDVPIHSTEGVEDSVEDAWSRVLRGDESDADAPRRATEGRGPEGAWSPNFPEKGRQGESTGWTRPKDQSRWR